LLNRQFEVEAGFRAAPLLVEHARDDDDVTFERCRDLVTDVVPLGAVTPPQQLRDAMPKRHEISAGASTSA
jgi:hypothetical protein